MTLSKEDKQLLVQRANDMNLRFNGVPVLVGGSGLEFAGVTVKPGHPLAGFSAEYSWAAIAQAIETGRLT